MIDLHDERYNELVVEVDDPDAAVKLIQNELRLVGRARFLRLRR